jgi:hypothetical protein
MNKIHGTTILTMPDGSQKRIPNSDVFDAAAEPTSAAAAPILQMFRECLSCRSTSGRLHELIFAYINGPAATKQETVN